MKSTFRVVLFIMSHAFEPILATTFTNYSYESLASDSVDWISSVKLPCHCRKACAEDELCHAVSTTVTVKPPLTRCEFSRSTNITTVSSEGTNTYVKSGCLSPFTRLPGIGCVWLSDSSAVFVRATTSCPKGSQLFSPASIDIFETLRLYFVEQKAELEDNFADDIYIGVEKVEGSSGKWRWSHGGTFEVHDRSGEYPFAGIEPDTTSLCARMRNSPGLSQYHLGDAPCFAMYNFLCQIL